MKIIFQFSYNKQYHFNFGYVTTMFQQIHWFTITSVDVHVDKAGTIIYISYARSIFSLFKHYKFWFKH